MAPLNSLIIKLGAGNRVGDNSRGAVLLNDPADSNCLSNERLSGGTAAARCIRWRGRITPGS
eukprot:102658-Hanusia_phi.AAC.1